MIQQKKINIAIMPDDLIKCEWTEDAIKLINERYLRRDKDGQIVETVEGMCWRVAYFIASADKKFGHTEEEIIALAKEFYFLMAERKFFPNAPTLYNAGTGNGLQFSACFVIPIGDSMDEIYDAIKWQAIIHKSGGGTGFSFSSLRPKNALIKSTRGRSSGPISFLEVFNTSTEHIKQGGMRRGANMAIMNVHHPDILDFIRSKSTLTGKNKITHEKIKTYLYSDYGLELLRKSLLATQIANFNISVAATDVFMKAVSENTEYNLIDPQDGKVSGRLKAREVFEMIVNMAWETGDPGLWFIDRTNAGRANPIPTLKTINATNPCGEQPLFDFDVCNLGSLNLANFVYKEGSGYLVDWENLGKSAELAVHFLDNVIELNPYPLPQIMDLAHKIRRIGLGVMGWADMLAYLDVPYASNNACKMAEEVSAFVNKMGHRESKRLAVERGPFPLWDQSIYKDDEPIRNCTVTTIAPTGEIRILAGCSGGVEPYFGLTETHQFEDRILRRLQPGFTRFVEIAKERGFYSPALIEEVKNRGHIGDLDGIPEEVKKVFVTTHEIAPEWHVRIQAAFQKNTDNGVSKTINLPNSATAADIEKVYWMAYELGCLGITVFRDGCKGGVLSVGVGKKAETKNSRDFIKSRPKLVLGSTIRMDTPDGAAFITINFDSEAGSSEPFELFVNVAKAGTDAAADAEAIGRLASAFLRLNSPKSAIERLVQLRDQLKGIGGSRVSGFGKDKVTSLADGISKAIDLYLVRFGFVSDIEKSEEKPVSDQKPEENIGFSGNRCPQCMQNTLIYEEGCVRCGNCSYNVC
ncbi:MAG: adenosylcobalamin-dependent ribonucleoside-diphosphate reductase [Candidatus Azambacteria bacterium]|nr:adenosylcobalamin-dependent ribonucleoside-diphosphate reductase [Candidatus Azambacteria bacterium]